VGLHLLIIKGGQRLRVIKRSSDENKEKGSNRMMEKMMHSAAS
jgi:hypothetical protein